jgi:hypothetical protein
VGLSRIGRVGQSGQDGGDRGGDFVVACGRGVGKRCRAVQHRQGDVIEQIRSGDAGRFAGVLMRTCAAAAPPQLPMTATGLSTTASLG